MSEGLHQTCLNHPLREAVAQCPDCRRPFCRECITEHDYRMICAHCLAEMRQKRLKEKTREIRLPLLPLLHASVALLVLWAVYYQIGEVLVNIPVELHDGNVWEEPDEP